MKRIQWIIVVLCGIMMACQPEQRNVTGAVVSSREEASKIGVAIMEQGGNAFDAMIATDLALAVCYPYAGNIGGGGFMVYRTQDGGVGTLDYRERAPEAATKDMYLDEAGNVIPKLSTLGGLAIGVPGTVAGLFAVHEKFGTLPFEQLIQPAIDMAREGFVVTAMQAKSWAKLKAVFIAINGADTPYAKEYKDGDRFVNEPLAKTLEAIRDRGKAGFYKGPVAAATVARVQEAGGILSLDDLAGYTPVWRDPITYQYKDLKIYSMPPPSSGGVCLGQILQMLAPYDIGQYPHNSPEALQLMVEAERRSYADRSKYLGDPDFVYNPTAELLAPTYLKDRMKDFNWEQASQSEAIAPGSVSWTESDETTHYSIIDRFGNAVAITTTLNGQYGSKVYVGEAGFFLNNEMDDFSSKPGTPNMFGLVGSEANAIAPKKRMLSSMTPTIIEKNGALALILGSPGGSTIITSVVQTILNVFEYNMPVQKAVEAPRVHHQWLPDVVVFEPNRFPQEVLDTLKVKGYNIEEKRSRIMGCVNAIHIDTDGIIHTGADPRREAKAAVSYK